MKRSAQFDPRLDWSEEEGKERFCTVELCGGEVSLGSQFRVWTKTPSYLSFVLEDGSDFASHHKPGDTLMMKVHRESMEKPGECLEASIRHIKKESHGKLTGQYLVALDILSATS